MAPFKTEIDGADVISISGDDVAITGEAATALALVINELATNAMKYGGLSRNGHGVSVACVAVADVVRIAWREPYVSESSSSAEGFGSKLIKMTIVDQLCGRYRRTGGRAGLEALLELPIAKLLEG